MLAGVSPDYYIRLEQGRTTHVSDQVLTAVARVLFLSEAEREHLRNLARSNTWAPVQASSEASDDTPLVRLLEAMTDVPALLIDVRMDIIAANATAEAVFDFAGSSHPANSAKMLFLAPDARARYTNWEAVAADTVAHLRLMTGRWPEDTGLMALIAELTDTSEAFKQVWNKGTVREKAEGTLHLMHPIVGRLEFEYHVLAVPSRPDRSLLTYVPVPGSPSEEALRVLGSWTAASVPSGER